jgi:capsular exopolysaccharide synthesis family protein
MASPKIPITEYFGHESPVATEYRRLFQNLRKTDGQGELKSILITSAVTGEGKSTISSLLAITAARKGNRTLLIDCDIRRPSIHNLFQLERGNGLVDVMQDGIPAKNVIKKTSLDRLDVITAGKVTPHPSELFDSRAIDGLMGELKFYYDYLILDSPPVIPVSDPMLLAQSVDGVLLVVKAGTTARHVALRAVDIMTSNRASVLGVVLNNASNSLPYYYDYTHYHYDYHQTGDVRNLRGAKHNTGGGASSDGKSRSGGKSSKDGKHLTR